MTVNITTARIQYDGDGVETAFTYPFRIYEDDDLLVIVTDENGEEDPLTLNTHYTVSGAGDDSGGTITLLSADFLDTNETMTILRDIDLTQETDYSDGQRVAADTLEAPPDKSRIIDQQFAERLSRSFELPYDLRVGNKLPMPEALKLWRWNSAATAIEYFSAGSVDLATPGDGTVTADKITYDAAIKIDLKTIAELRAQAGIANAVVYLSGYYAAGDGGGGLFYWHTTSTDADNGGTIIKVTGLATGRWIRTDTNMINIKMFGAVGDQVTDDTTAIQAAMTYVGSDGKIFIPEGIYLVSSALSLSCSLEGPSQRASIIECNDNTKNIINVTDGTDFFEIKNLGLRYETTVGATGTALFLTNENHNSLFENLEIQGGLYGIHSDQLSFWQTYRNVRVQFTLDTSFKIDGTRNDTTGAGTTVVFENCGAYNGALGLVCNTVLEVVINSFEIGTHSDTAWHFTDCFNVVLNGIHAEANDYGSGTAKSHVFLWGSSAVISGLTSQNNTSTGTHYVIRVGEGASFKFTNLTEQTNTNQELYYIEDAGSPGIVRRAYSFDGHGFDSTSTGSYQGGSTGQVSFPDYEEWVYTNDTDANGEISQNYPSVPAILSLFVVNSFVDDGYTTYYVATDRFGASYSSRIKNPDGTNASVASISIRSILMYKHLS